MKLLHSKFKIKKSITLGVVLSLSHIGAIFCVGLSELGSIWWEIALIICILVNLIVVIRHYVLLNNTNAVIELGFGIDDRIVVWYLRSYSGNLTEALIDYPVFISNYLIIINFISREQRLKVTVPIVVDALILDEFRKLKMLLKTSR